MHRISLLLSITLSAFQLFLSCSSDSPDTSMSISSNFESGSIGWVEERDWQNWDIYLKDDNDNDELRDSYRNWWYIRLDGVYPGHRVTLTLKNRGWRYYYIPVYSYDQITWHRFTESEVTISDGCEEGLEECILEISTSRFIHTRVYVARFYPYTTQNLEEYFTGIEDSPYVTISSLGKSSGYGADIPIIKVEDPDVDDNEKRAVWMHARSHPAETGSSFLVEGAINQLLEDLASNLESARTLVFYIAPMHCVDGVIEGNYRTDLYSRNLEIEWILDDDQYLYISENSARENRLLNQQMAELVNNTSYREDLIALNLHSSNSPPDTPAFSYPHFGDDPEVYSIVEISLWEKSLSFIGLINDYYDGRFSPPPEEGGGGFLNYSFPEAWWWRNMADDSLAITIETVYSKAGFDHWITPDDIRELGESITLAIYDYYETDVVLTKKKRFLKMPVEGRIKLPDEIDNKL